MIKIYRGFFAVVVVVLSCLFSVKAQSSSLAVPNLFRNPVLQRHYENTQMINQIASRQLMGQLIRNSAGAGKKSRSSRNNQTPQPVAVGPTSFKQTPANSIVKTIADEIGKTAAERKEAEEFFKGFVDRYVMITKKDGFPSNDMASGFLYYIINNYAVYHNVFEDAYDYGDITKHRFYTPLSNEKAVYTQFRTLLTGIPDIGKMSDKEKQQFTEMMAIMTRVTFQLYDIGLQKRDEEMIEKARELAKDNLEKMFQTSPDKIVINDDGVSITDN